MIARAMIGSCGKLASTDAPDVVLRVLLLTPSPTPTSTNCTTEAYHDAAARTRTRTRSLHRYERQPIYLIASPSFCTVEPDRVALRN
ncbi:hypothetical protein RJ55_04423 [Drechmeria coniospora]|nr:hypothetical protein RJ55_04423 [Drechmeria coniospora]